MADDKLPQPKNYPALVAWAKGERKASAHLFVELGRLDHELWQVLQAQEVRHG